MTKEELIEIVEKLTPAEREEMVQILSGEAERGAEEQSVAQSEQERLVTALRNRGLTLRRWTAEEVERIWGFKPRFVSYEELDAVFKKLKSPLSEQIIRDRGEYCDKNSIL